MNPEKVWINGTIRDARAPLLSVYDRGFLYGDGVYETLRVEHGRLFHFDEHYRRLKNSARGLGLRVPYGGKVLRRGVERLLKSNGLRDAVLRITLTRGPGPLGFDPRPAKTPTCVMIATPPRRHAEDLYRRGVLLAVARVRRTPATSLDPAFKSTNNLNNILAKMEAVKRGAYEALMLNIRGDVAEGTISNVFFISGKILRTPSLDCGILSGVTRSVVLALAKREGLKVAEGHYSLKRLFRAEEVFITSTTMEVMPVTRIADESGKVRRVGNGRVGDWSRRLRAAYQKEISRMW